MLTGAFDELLAMLHKSKEPPRFEFEVRGDIKGVPIVGKPDCRFIHECGVHVILDWKVGILLEVRCQPFEKLSSMP